MYVQRFDYTGIISDLYSTNNKNTISGTELFDLAKDYSLIVNNEVYNSENSIILKK